MKYKIITQNKNNEILSIKRMSDGEIFSIGDRVVETIRAWNGIIETDEFTIYRIPSDSGVVYSENINRTDNGEDSGEYNLFNITHIK